MAQSEALASDEDNFDADSTFLLLSIPLAAEEDDESQLVSEE